MARDRVMYKEVGDVLAVLKILDKWETNHPNYEHQLHITNENRYYIEVLRDATKEGEGLD